MAIARKELIDPYRSGCYHLISRCVRRAFLCGDAWNHRRDWMAEAVELATRCSSVEVLSFAVMSNHVHLVVKTHPERANEWSDAEVAERWAAWYPPKDRDGQPLPWPPEQVAALAADPIRCATYRQRLGSVSWMMKVIKERIARLANAEDQCRGHFWEQRFQSVKLLDQAALLTCMVYVDLNPIRAQMAATPEKSTYTSVRERIHARQAHRYAQAADPAKGEVLTPALRQTLAGGPEHGLWIAPIADCIVGKTDCIDSPRPISLDNYLDLVDATGRIFRGDKRGAIPAHLLPILQRLDLDVDSWLNLMRSHGRCIGSAIGHYAARVAEAARRGVEWIRNTMPDLMSGKPPPGSTAVPMRTS